MRENEIDCNLIDSDMKGLIEKLCCGGTELRVEKDQLMVQTAIIRYANCLQYDNKGRMRID